MPLRRQVVANPHISSGNNANSGSRSFLWPWHCCFVLWLLLVGSARSHSADGPGVSVQGGVITTDELLEPLIPQPPKLHQEASLAPVSDIISTAMEEYVGKLPTNQAYEEGKFVGWPGTVDASHDVAAAAASQAAAKTLARLVRREADQSTPPSPSSLIESAASRTGALQPCTLGEDYRGKYCDYTNDLAICAEIEPTRDEQGQKNYWKAVGKKEFKSSGNGFECISLADYDKYVGINSCRLDINCDATYRARICKRDHKEGRPVMDEGQRCIAEACSGNCGRYPLS